VILERELAAMRAQAPQRHREGPRLFRPSIVVNEARKVVALFPRSTSICQSVISTDEIVKIRLPRAPRAPVERTSIQRA
jgi:hypothetical protein